MSSDEFRARLAALLDELVGDEGRLVVGVVRWLRRVLAG